MLKRILGLLGWLGVALVFAAVAVRFLKPEQQPLYNWLAIAGLVCTLLYILSQWREVIRSFSGREARFGTLAFASIAVVLAILIGDQLPGVAAEQALGPDGCQAVHAVGADQEGAAGARTAGQLIRVFDRSEGFERFRERLDEYKYTSDKVSVEYIDVDRRPADGAALRGAAARDGGVRVRRPGRTGDVGRRAGADQRAHQGRSRDGRARSTSSRVMARRVQPGRTAMATTRSRRRSPRRTSRTPRWCWRSSRKFRPTPPS